MKPSTSFAETSTLPASKGRRPPCAGRIPGLMKSLGPLGAASRILSQLFSQRSGLITEPDESLLRTISEGDNLRFRGGPGLVAFLSMFSQRVLLRRAFALSDFRGPKEPGNKRLAFQGAMPVDHHRLERNSDTDRRHGELDGLKHC